MKTFFKTHVLFLLLLLLISCSSHQDRKPVVSTYETGVKATLKTGEDVRVTIKSHIEVRGEVDKQQFQNTCERVIASVLQQISLRRMTHGYRQTAANLIEARLENEYSPDIVVRGLYITELRYAPEIEEKIRVRNWTINEIQKQKDLRGKYQNELKARKHEYQQTRDHTKKSGIEALEKLIADSAGRLKTLEAELASIKKDLFQSEQPDKL